MQYFALDLVQKCNNWNKKCSHLVHCVHWHEWSTATIRKYTELQSAGHV